jgi:hypothetical protein
MARVIVNRVNRALDTQARGGLDRIAVAFRDFHELRYGLTRVKIELLHEQRRRVMNDVRTPIPARESPVLACDAVLGHMCRLTRKGRKQTALSVKRSGRGYCRLMRFCVV